MPRLCLSPVFAVGLFLAGVLLSGCPPQQVQVPDVVGQTQAGAQSLILARGLGLGTVTQQFSDAVPVGNVISQNPAAGAQLAPGASVALVISLGPQPVDVPNVVGQAQAAAETALTDAGLTVGTVTQQASDVVPAGEVISQNPAANASVASGTPVNLVVSTGSAEIAINSLSELQLIGNDPAYPLNGDYVLANDIDAAAKGVVNFVPIGTAAAPFVGKFDGQGYAIINLSIDRPAESNVGLFGYVGQFDSETILPSISNLDLTGGTVNGNTFVGALVGYGGSGTITNCQVSTEVNGVDTVGGLIGFCAMDVDTCDSSSNVAYSGPFNPNVGAIGGLIGVSAAQSEVMDSTSSGVVSGPMSIGGLIGGNGGTLRRCFSSATVFGASYTCGGLAGSHSGLIVRCTSTGPVTGTTKVGGLVGESAESDGVTQSYAISSVMATDFGAAGGLIGFNFNSDVTESFAEGNVNNTSTAGGNGGLIGILGGSSVVRDCYARGDVSGFHTVGALVGEASFAPPGVTIINCYATGAVTSPGDTGGITAYFDTNFGAVTITNCFWDTEATGLATTFENAGTGASTTAMQTASTYTAVSWDFDTVWNIVSGYPVLQWLQEE